MDTDGSDWPHPEPDSAEMQDPPKVFEDVWVRVWFGPTAVAHYRADRELAERYVTDVGSHFQGLRFTVDPLPSRDPPIRHLPAEQLWMLGP